MGIEPTTAAWEAAVLPLNYIRRILPIDNTTFFKVAQEGETAGRISNSRDAGIF